MVYGSLLPANILILISIENDESLILDKLNQAWNTMSFE